MRKRLKVTIKATRQLLKSVDCPEDKAYLRGMLAKYSKLLLKAY